MTYIDESAPQAAQKEYELVLVDEPAPRVRRITLNRPEKRTRSTTPCGASSWTPCR